MAGFYDRWRRRLGLARWLQTSLCPQLNTSISFQSAVVAKSTPQFRPTPWEIIAAEERRRDRYDIGSAPGPDSQAKQVADRRLYIH